MGAPIIFSGNNAKLLKPNLDFFGNNQILTGSVDPTSVATNANTGSLYLNNSTGKTYQKQDNGTTTNWSVISASGAVGSLNYAQAYFDNTAYWTTTSTSFVDPTVGAAGVFTVRQSNGITLTRASGNLPGVTFTPASATAVYQIIAKVGSFNTTVSQPSIPLLTDGTTVIAQGAGMSGAGINLLVDETISGIYTPGTTSPVTVKVQICTGSGGAGTAYLTGLGSGTIPESIPLEFTVTRIDTLVSAGGGSGITRSVNVISTPTTAAAAANTDYIYLVSGTTTLTLPTAVGNTNQYTVKRTGTGIVTIATTSSQTIDGVTTQLIYSSNGAMSMVSDGSNWQVVSTNGLSTARVGGAIELSV